MLHSDFGHKRSEEDPLSRFLSFLRDRRNGSILLAWRLDLDKNGAGQVSHPEFVSAMRRMGIAAEARTVWESLRPDGSLIPVSFHELAPREAANLEDFANTLWREVGFEFDHAWSQYIDLASRRVATMEEFVRGVRRLGFQGNAQLLFRGFDMSGPNSMLTRRDFESMRGVALEFVRTHHGPEAARQLQALAQESGDVQHFIALINFSSNGRRGSFAGDCSTMPVATFATRLRALSFQGDCLAAAAFAAKCAGGPGQLVSSSALRVLLSSDPSTFGQSLHAGSAAPRPGDTVSPTKTPNKTRIEPGTVSDVSSHHLSQKKLQSSHTSANVSKQQPKGTTARLKASLGVQNKPTLEELKPKGVGGLRGLNAAHGGGFKSDTPLVVVDVGRGGATASTPSRKRPGESSSSSSSESSSTGFSSTSDDASDASGDESRARAGGGHRRHRGHRGIAGGSGSGRGRGQIGGSRKGTGFRGGPGETGAHGYGSGGRGYGRGSGGNGLGGSTCGDGTGTGGLGETGAHGYGSGDRGYGRGNGGNGLGGGTGTGGLGGTGAHGYGSGGRGYGRDSGGNRHGGGTCGDGTGTGGSCGGEGGTGGRGGGGFRAGSPRGSPVRAMCRLPKRGDDDSSEDEVCAGMGVAGSGGGLNCKEGGSSSSRAGRSRISAGTGEVSDGTSILAAITTGCTGGTPRAGHSPGRRQPAYTGKLLARSLSRGRSSSGERRRSFVRIFGRSVSGERRRPVGSLPKAKEKAGRRTSRTKADDKAKDESQDSSKDESNDDQKGKGEKDKGKGDKGKGKKGKGEKGKGDKGKGENEEEKKDEEKEDEEKKDEGSKDDETGKGKGKGKKGPPAKGEKGEKGKDGKGKDGKGKDGKGKGQEPRKPEIKPPVVLKKLFWTSFRIEKNEEAQTKTVWDAIEKDGVEMNLEELNILFKDEPPAPSKLASQMKDDAKDATAPKGRQRLQVLENQRRRQICVMLARLPGLPETKSALDDMNQDKLSKDQVELLLMNVPSQEEVQLMQQAKQDHANDPDSFWDNAEEFVLSVMGISQLQLRLQVWDFENNFQERFDHILSSFTIVEKGCNSVLNTVGIRRLLSLVLHVGNYLNAGTNRGRADGFSLDTLSKMRSVKMSASERPGGTLVDYIVQQMERTYPAELEEIFAPGHDAEIITLAARPKIEDMAEDAKGFRRSVGEMLNRVRQAREKGDDSSEVFLQHSEILSMCDVELEELQVRVAGLKHRYSDICRWFHIEDKDSKMTLDEFFGIWDKFLGDVKAARRDYQALERKREAKEKEEKQKQDRQASIGRRKEMGGASSRNSSMTRPASVESRARSSDNKKPNIRRNFPSAERKSPTSPEEQRKSVARLSASTFSSERRSSLGSAKRASFSASLAASLSASVIETRAASHDRRRLSLPCRSESHERRRASLPYSPGERSSYGLALQLRYSAPPTPASASPAPRKSLSAESSPMVEYRSLQLDSNRRSVRLRTNDSVFSVTSDASDAFDSPRSSRQQGFDWTQAAGSQHGGRSQASRPQTGTAMWQAAVKQIIANRSTLWSSLDKEELQSLGRDLDGEQNRQEQNDASLKASHLDHTTECEEKVTLDSTEEAKPHAPPCDAGSAEHKIAEDSFNWESRPQTSLESSGSIVERGSRGDGGGQTEAAEAEIEQRKESTYTAEIENLQEQNKQHEHDSSQGKKDLNLQVDDNHAEGHSVEHQLTFSSACFENDSRGETGCAADEKVEFDNAGTMARSRAPDTNATTSDMHLDICSDDLGEDLHKPSHECHALSARAEKDNTFIEHEHCEQLGYVADGIASSSDNKAPDDKSTMSEVKDVIHADTIVKAHEPLHCLSHEVADLRASPEDDEEALVGKDNNESFEGVVNLNANREFVAESGVSVGTSSELTVAVLSPNRDSDDRGTHAVDQSAPHQKNLENCEGVVHLRVDVISSHDDDRCDEQLATCSTETHLVSVNEVEKSNVATVGRRDGDEGTTDNESDSPKRAESLSPRSRLYKDVQETTDVVREQPASKGQERTFSNGSFEV